MPTTSDPVDVGVLTENEWEMMDKHRWWYTPFSTVSWSYPGSMAAVSNSPNPFFRHAKPPCSLFSLHQTGFTTSEEGVPSVPNDLTVTEGDCLNPELIGVKGAEEVLKKYEIDVGFHHTADPLPSCPGNTTRCSLGQEFDEDQLAIHKERWQQLARELTGGVAMHGVRSLDCSAVSQKSLQVTISTGSSCHIPGVTENISPTDITGSQGSIFSDHTCSSELSTSPWNMVAKNQRFPSPGGDPSRRALSSTPPDTSTSLISTPCASAKPQIQFSSNPSRASTRSLSPSFTNYTSRSQDCTTESHSPSSVSFQKDENGFYITSHSSDSHGQAIRPQRLSSALLPSFLAHSLRRRKPSKTRPIVDLIRSSSNLELRTRCKSVGHSPTSSVSCSPSGSTSTFNNLDLDFFKPRLSVSEDGGDSQSSLSSSPAIEFEEDDDGWIRPGVSVTETTAETRRTRELRLALARHRYNSASDKEDSKECGSDIRNDLRVEEKSSTSATTDDDGTSTTNDDGWIEGPCQLRSSDPLKRATANHLQHSINAPMPTPTHVPPPLSTPIGPLAATTTGAVHYPYPILPPPSYFAYPLTPYATAAYIQMPIQLHSQMQFRLYLQAQSHLHPHNNGHFTAVDWVPPPSSLYPTGMPPSHLGQAPISATTGFRVVPGVGDCYGGRLYTDSGNITGTSGMRHVLR